MHQSTGELCVEQASTVTTAQPINPTLPSEPSEAFFTQNVLPCIRRMALHRTRHYRCAADRDDMLQQAAMIGWNDYLTVFKQGKQTVATVATLARYAVWMALSGRNPRGCGRVGKRIPRDISSPHSAKHHAFRKHGMDAGDLSLRDRQSSPAKRAEFELDFTAWAATRSEQEQRVMRALGAGFKPFHHAEQLGVSCTWISLARKRWVKSWRLFCE